MDYRKFVKELPSLYENWGEDSVTPKLNRFGKVKQQVKGMTTVSVMQLLNFAVECMEPDEIYCEVGTYQGASLIGSLLDRPGVLAYAVDNFSLFDEKGENFDILTQNLSKFDLTSSVTFHNQNMEEFFVKLKANKEKEKKFGVYFYDGAHDYRSQLLGLLWASPFLAKQAVIVVDDTISTPVNKANRDFIATHPQCEMLLDLPTPKFGHPTFWSGIQVLSWDADRNSNPKQVVELLGVIPSWLRGYSYTNYPELVYKYHKIKQYLLQQKSDQ